MKNEVVRPGLLSDAELLTELERLAAAERTSTSRLVAALAEVDKRQLYLGQGCSSMFVYCTRVLRLSEHAAYGRIEAARLTRRFPAVLQMLEHGELTLTSIGLLAPLLCEDNSAEVLARARHQSKREVEEIVASLRPRPDVMTTVRKLPDRPAPLIDTTAPASLPAASPTALSRAIAPLAQQAPAVVAPIAPERYKLQVTLSRATREKLESARSLMRHSIPSGDIAMILDRALDLLLADIGRKKFASTTQKRSSRETGGASRRIPAIVRRRVWSRDRGRCAFKGARGRCDETGFLEFHHVRPFAEGGEATAENIELRCRAHNQYEAHLFFGVPQEV